MVIQTYGPKNLLSCVKISNIYVLY